MRNRTTLAEYKTELAIEILLMSSNSEVQGTRDVIAGVMTTRLQL